ncbi:unnamed protein product [marine sediment metagenome]|uniref:Transketolase-like pyrimidine-binding domain-containing protein n=1 Tax=marine sediment metagenome TaxID=412755 RepID=X1JCU5_9ZZZZ
MATRASPCDVRPAPFPDRFFECKIAEQNMISTAVGLAAGGLVPFVSSFGKFLSRGYDQVKMASISRANVKLVGSHAGVSLGSDGPSQMSLPDVAFFRSFCRVDDGSGRGACFVAAAQSASSKLFGILPNLFTAS